MFFHRRKKEINLGREIPSGELAKHRHVRGATLYRYRSGGMIFDCQRCPTAKLIQPSGKVTEMSHRAAWLAEGMSKQFLVQKIEGRPLKRKRKL